MPKPVPTDVFESTGNAAEFKSKNIHRRKTVLNVLWNWAGVGIEVLTGFLITPLLILKLGNETYGLWILIGSMIGCIGMFDLGLRGAIGRYVALYHAKGDHQAIRQVLSTASVALAAAGTVALGVVVMATWALPFLYTISSDKMEAVRSAAWICGIQLSLFFVLRMFDATLWAYQRFDLLNLVDIPTSLARTCLIIGCVSQHSEALLTLAWISLTTVTLSGLAKAWLTYRTTPGLAIRPVYASWEMLRALVVYGFWNFTIAVAWLARTQLSPLLVGSFIGVKAVAPFSVVMRLPATAIMVLTAATGVFTPVAVAIHAGDDIVRRRRLLFEGTRLSLSLSLYFLSMFIWLGEPLLSTWLHPEFGVYWPLLVIAGCGEVLPMAMSVAAGIIHAMSQHRRLAWLVAGETAVGLAAASVAGSAFGLIGFVVSLAVAATLFRGVFVWFYVCRITNIRSSALARGTLLTPLLAAAVACVPLHIAVNVQPPTDWILLLIYAATFTLIYACTVSLSVYGHSRMLATGQLLVSVLIRPRLQLLTPDE